jgi:site-specific recombinase XerD
MHWLPPPATRLSEKADATRRATLADIRHFTTWCEAVGAIALPATPATVAAYLAAVADSGLKVATISRRAAAIAYAHKLAGFEPHEPPAPAHDELREAVATLDPDTMSPHEAHAALYELKWIAEKKKPDCFRFSPSRRRGVRERSRRRGHWSQAERRAPPRGPRSW